MPKSASEFIDLGIVQQHIDLAAEQVAGSAEAGFKFNMDGELRHCNWSQFDSPLEVLFYIWWNAVITIDGVYGHLITIHPQQEVTVDGRLFRLDFMVSPVDQELGTSRSWTPMAVEVDGHAFHERTAEQVILRDQRDRCLQSSGWKVFHFSYNEFTSNPIDCVLEVWAFARQNWRITSRAVTVSHSAPTDPASLAALHERETNK